MFESLDVGFLSGVAVPIGHPYVVAGAFDSVPGHGKKPMDPASTANELRSELSRFFFSNREPFQEVRIEFHNHMIVLNIESLNE